MPDSSGNTSLYSKFSVAIFAKADLSETEVDLLDDVVAQARSAAQSCFYQKLAEHEQLRGAALVKVTDEF